MKKVLLLLAIICFPLLAFAQISEKQHYIYNMVILNEAINEEGFRVDLDNGKTVERLKDKDGKKIRFYTPSAVLMYFISEGWELYNLSNATEGSVYNGIGNSSAILYWIIRKPCTKEEFDKAVDEGMR
ncbi:MAG: hypothetical protein E7096_03765 [Bacteroides sp.]|nr:hypothetical protein [Bacteroides sp.]